MIFVCVCVCVSVCACACEKNCMLFRVVCVYVRVCAKRMSPIRTISNFFQAIQGFMAGAYVSLGALFANIMEANFKGWCFQSVV